MHLSINDSTFSSNLFKSDSFFIILQFLINSDNFLKIKLINTWIKAIFFFLKALSNIFQLIIIISKIFIPISEWIFCNSSFPLFRQIEKKKWENKMKFNNLNPISLNCLTFFCTNLSISFETKFIPIFLFLFPSLFSLLFSIW